MKISPVHHPFLEIRHARLPLVVVLVLVSASVLPASIIFTREAPGVQQTSVVGAVTHDFDLLPVGQIGSFVSGGATYSAGAAIVAPDAFGGSNQTRYISVGAQSGTTELTVTFSGLRTYFGFYWAAGDAQNRIEFFEGSAQQGAFSVGDIIPGLASSYFGNPNTGQNSSEPYVYLNFTSSDNASRFNRVVFHNSSTGSGFETDNHSVFDELIPPPSTRGVPPGTHSPEPSSYALMAAGVAGLWLVKRRAPRSQG